MTERTMTTEQSERLATMRDIAADIFTVEPGQVETAESFRNDLEVDSLLVIELLTQLEKTFGIEIADEEMPRMVNLGGVYDVVAEIAGW